MRKWFGDLSIRWKLTIVIAAAVLAVLAASALAFLAFDLRSNRDAMAREVTALADLLGSASGTALASHDSEAARATLESVRIRPSITSARLFDATGRLLATYRHGGYSSEIPKIPASGETEFRNGRLIVHRPVSYRGEILGSVTVEADLGELNGRMLSSGVTSAILFLVAAGAGLLLAIRLQKVISLPILGLADAAQAVARQKSYGVRVGKAGNDEIGGVTDAFNGMLEEIQARDEALQAARGELRDRVKELQAEASEREKAQNSLQLREEEHRHLALLDPLTSLPNRALFHDRLKVALARASRAQERMAVLSLDVDRFKLVNDSMGHDFGDQLLVEVAGRLRGCVRDEDTLARVGSDEFVTLLPTIQAASDAAGVARRMLASLQEPLPSATAELVVSASIGISIYPDDGRDVETLLEKAASAMVRAKQAGRGTFQLYEAELHARTMRRVMTERELHAALQRDELRLFFQPVVDLSTGQIVAAEALIRWDHPHRGMVVPNDFIPLAEETGLIITIGAWALEAACCEAASWPSEGLPPIRILVNVSARQFLRADIVGNVAAVLARTGIEPARLELELTESVAMDDVEVAIDRMKQLRELGVRLSIDDFGTGYSSLTYLYRFPLDTLKLDHSFVKGIAEGGWNGTVAQAIVALGHGLGANVVAEGVETEEQASVVRILDCDLAQGFLLFRPLVSTDLRGVLRANARETGPLRHRPKPIPVDPLQAVRANAAASGLLEKGRTS